MNYKYPTRFRTYLKKSGSPVDFDCGRYLLNKPRLQRTERLHEYPEAYTFTAGSHPAKERGP